MVFLKTKKLTQKYYFFFQMKKLNVFLKRLKLFVFQNN